MAILGYKNVSKFRNTYLNPLLGKSLIITTIVDKPTSSKQEYRLMEIGRDFLEKEKKED